MEAEDNTIDCERKHNVVVTGFGVFRDHLVNPSWEAIRDGQLKIDRPNINLIVKQVDVSYEQVDNAIPNIWKDLKPLLVVHIGLAAHETSIRIEQIARHGPYIHDDVVQHAPHKHLRHYKGDEDGCLEENVIRRGYSCKPCDFGCSTTCIDVDRVCTEMNRAFDEGKLKLPTKISKDAGLYVCEYIYQKSLCISDRCVFIHVPDVENFKIDDIRTSLKYCIEILVDEVLNAQK